MAIVNYRNTDKNYFYLPLTLSGGNMLSYGRGREYKYSNYQQVIQSMSQNSHELFRGLLRTGQNKNPRTYRHDSLDVVYTCPKPEGLYKFKYKEHSDDTEWTEILDSRIANYEQWWYDSLPTRIFFEEEASPAVLFNSVTPEKRIPVDSFIGQGVSLYVRLASPDGSFIHNVYDNSQYNSKIILYGRDKNDIYRREEFDFFYSSVKKSEFAWKYLESVECVLFDDYDKFSLSIASSFDFKSFDFIEDRLMLEDKDITLRPALWSFDGSTLLLREFAAKNVSDMHAGIKDINTIGWYGFMYYNGESFESLDVIDSFISSEHDESLYVTSQGYLLKYSKFQRYSPLVKAASQMQTTDPFVNLDVSVDKGLATLKGECNVISLNATISKYRFTITLEDGTKFTARDTSPDKENSEWMEFDQDYWIDYPLPNTYGFYSPVVSYGDGTLFSQDFIASIEVWLSNGQIEKDTFIVERQKKYPLFQLKLPLGYLDAMKLSYNSKGLLCLSDDRTAYSLKFINDTFIVDDNTQQVIFAYNYGKDLGAVKHFRLNDSIGTDVSLTPFNVLTELDQWGAVMALERKPGEKSSDYTERLSFVSANKIDSTHTGLVNAVSAELGLKVSDMFLVSGNAPFELSIRHPYLSIDGEVLNLYDDITLDNVKDFLQNQGFTVNVFNNTMLPLPARCLLDASNISYKDKLIFEGKSAISLSLGPHEYISPDTKIDNLTYVPASPAANEFAISGKTIITGRPLSIYDIVNIKIFTSSFLLKASPVIVSDLHSTESMHFGFNEITDYARQVISEADKYYPNKWNS